jgi:hypothetical protein
LARWGVQVGDGVEPSEQAGAKECSTVLKLIALAAAAASTTAPPALVSTAPWWEKVTVTISGDGNPRSCHYESSRLATGTQECEVEGQAQSIKASASGTPDEFTSITFERRFSPGSEPDKGSVQLGDTLLGGQVLALAIDASGAVRGCKVVASAGEMTPDYGCAEAKAERFEAGASRNAETPRQGYLTVLVYAHAENVA